MTPSLDAAILCHLTTCTHASAVEVGTALRITAAEVRAHLVALKKPASRHQPVGQGHDATGEGVRDYGRGAAENDIVISAAQVWEALALLGWALSTLAGAALISFDKVAHAQDNMGIQDLGGFQLDLIHADFDEAGVEFILKSASGGVRLQKAQDEPNYRTC